MQEYDQLLDLSMNWLFGTKDREMDFSSFQKIYEKQFVGKGFLVLKQIKNYHREYLWS